MHLPYRLTHHFFYLALAASSLFSAQTFAAQEIPQKGKSLSSALPFYF
jgi:hypothetical protein